MGVGTELVPQTAASPHKPTAVSRQRHLPLEHVRAFAGHTDLTTTQGYVHKIENEGVTAAVEEAMAQ